MIHHFVGTARERGAGHGEALREAIRQRAATSLPPAVVDDPDLAADLAGRCLAAMDVGHRHAADELAGIAAGSGVHLDLVVLLNAFEAFSLDTQVELGGCTAIGYRDGGRVLVTQNWDANPSLAATLSIQVHRGPDTPAVVVVASPGGLGWIGMNGHGVALVTNDLLTRGSRPGVPSQPARRTALLAASASAAVASLRDGTTQAGRAYLVGDAAGQLHTVELCAEVPTGVALRHGGHTAHTNHALDPSIRIWEDTGAVRLTYPSSSARQRRALDLAAGQQGVPEAAVAARLLADHAGAPTAAICRHEPDRESTVTAASVVFDCAERRAHITLGPACAGPPVTLDL